MAIRDNLGGGGAVLDTLEEIAANTEPGKHAGALAVKELTESLEWKQLPESALPITIPNGTKEFYALVKNDISSVYRMTPILPSVHGATWILGSGFYIELDNNNILKSLTELVDDNMYPATSVKLFYR